MTCPLYIDGFNAREYLMWFDLELCPKLLEPSHHVYQYQIDLMLRCSYSCHMEFLSRTKWSYLKLIHSGYLPWIAQWWQWLEHVTSAEVQIRSPIQRDTFSFPNSLSICILMFICMHVEFQFRNYRNVLSLSIAQWRGWLRRWLRISRESAKLSFIIKEAQ